LMHRALQLLFRRNFSRLYFDIGKANLSFASRLIFPSTQLVRQTIELLSRESDCIDYSAMHNCSSRIECLKQCYEAERQQSPVKSINQVYQTCAIEKYFRAPCREVRIEPRCQAMTGSTFDRINLNLYIYDESKYG